ncbi:hypothetical protein MPH47_09760 [Psychrobacillus psychrodurans]|uniref:hypothetical protein n=1 Tax=Psychrobacillus psychrodurans TaxID=126157 RepID=UPI001F4DC384|nr:hypothetical protein [Psychrobacillus psychrodurans]MCK1997502.1 hypothetical protein [Psychrobacillus psychrodurans]
MGEDFGVASTEAIRCGSLRNKPEVHLDCSLENFQEIINANTEQMKKQIKKQWVNVTEKIRINCLSHFKKLIDHSDYNIPLLIICNGKPACRSVADILLPTRNKREQFLKEYEVDNLFEIPTYSIDYKKQGLTHNVTVIQSDFMGNFPSNLTRRHVGVTIKNVMEKLDLVRVRESLIKGNV